MKFNKGGEARGPVDNQPIIELNNVGERRSEYPISQSTSIQLIRDFRARRPAKH